ncbi:MAG: fibrobacter succinogenes major paralogous domain-containing protein [Bacteroidales bacterium]
MKSKYFILPMVICITIGCISIFQSCQKLDFSGANKSNIDTIYLSNSNTINIILDVFDLKQNKNKSYGICYSTTNNMPTLSDSLISISEISETKKYIIQLSNLNPDTKYYFRGYIIEDDHSVSYSFNTREFTLPQAAMVTTKDPTFIKANSAICGGNVIYDGGSPFTAKGICWNTSPDPTTSNSIYIFGSGLGSFTCSLSDLNPTTTYYVRAFASNSFGTVYGDEKSFTTLTPGFPVVNSVSVSSITLNSASVKGEVVSDENSDVTNRGVCWSLINNPTIADNSATAGSGLGNFECNLTGLSESTTYYTRAFATNSSGTSYGQELSFTTSTPGMANVVTKTATSVTQFSANCNGEVISDGWSAITERGICWSTNPNPTIADNKLINGTGIGNYSVQLTGLTLNTMYFFRAYAVNNFGIAYGDIVEFTTSSEGVTDIDGNIYNIVTIGTQVWMKENLKTTKFKDGTSIPLVSDPGNWSSLYSSGFCWLNDDPNSFKNEFGGLYNWYAVNDTRNICPSGWHIPTEADFNELINYLGGYSVAGGKMKESGTTLWTTPNIGATNESGFSALPASYRNIYGTYSPGAFLKNTYFWTNSEQTSNSALYYTLGYNTESIISNSLEKQNGFSVRCIKN